VRYGLAQATSYCDTLAVFTEFCGCSPAYTPPDVPDGLNAEPGAVAELPGVLGAVALPQVWLGWPVLAGPSWVVRVGLLRVVVMVLCAPAPMVRVVVVLSGFMVGPRPAAAAGALNIAASAATAQQVIENFMEGLLSNSGLVNTGPCARRSIGDVTPVKRWQGGRAHCAPCRHPPHKAAKSSSFGGTRFIPAEGTR
jgi:hypothetical protein